MVGQYVGMIVAPKTRKGTIAETRTVNGRVEYLLQHDPRFDDRLPPSWLSETDLEVCERPTDKQVVAMNIFSKQLSSSIRVLVVDDFENWRRQVRLVLQARPEWQVISDASDGLEAVQKAQDLKPEIILLGLPKLNGIEAARRIRQRSPSSKIIFLSQNSNLASG
jgi:Response regulator receiver domain